MVVTHTPSLAVLGLIFAILLVASTTAGNGSAAKGLDKAAVVRVGTAVAIGAALGACVLLPAYGHQDLQGPFIGWGTPPLGERLLQVWRGEFLFRPHVAFFVVVGLGYAVLRVLRGLPFAVPLVVAPLTYMVIAHVLQHQWPSSLVMQQLSNRGIGYAGTLALLPLGALIAWGTGSLARLGDVIAVAMAAAIVVLPLGPMKDYAREMLVPVPQMAAAAAELSRVVPDSARFATQRDYPGEIARTNMIQPDRWLAWKSGKNTLNIFHATSSLSAGPAFETDHIVDRSPAAVAQSLSRYGVTHLVTVSDPAADQIATSNRFILVWRESPLAIFALTPNAGQPDPGALITADQPISAGLVDWKPEKMAIDVSAGQPSRAQVAVSWSPKWHATIDGRSVALDKGADGMATLNVPSGDHRIVLRFRQDVWDRLGQLISVATIGLGGAWLWRRRRLDDAVPPVPEQFFSQPEPL
jgi:hypothetical protein